MSPACSRTTQHPVGRARCAPGAGPGGRGCGRAAGSGGAGWPGCPRPAARTRRWPNLQVVEPGGQRAEQRHLRPAENRARRLKVRARSDSCCMHAPVPPGGAASPPAASRPAGRRPGSAGPAQQWLDGERPAPEQRGRCPAQRRHQQHHRHEAGPDHHKRLRSRKRWPDSSTPRASNSARAVSPSGSPPTASSASPSANIAHGDSRSGRYTVQK